MKTWFGVFNCIALGMILIMLSGYYIQMDTMKTEYDTNRLNQVISYAGEAAFLETIHVGNLELAYNEMSDVVLNPACCLDVFEDMVCLNYGMVTSLENKQYVENCIPSALLACNDGYYITLLSEIDTNPDKVTGQEYGFKWSMKLPYTVTHNESEISINLLTEKWIKASYQGSMLLLTSGDRYSDPEVNRVLSHKIAQRSINTSLTNAISRNIDLVSRLRGGVNYNIYLPAYKTFSGINDIKSPSLIILLQGTDFSGQAKVEEAVISGLKTVDKVYVIGFRDTQGKKRYCYEGQLPDELKKSVDSFFGSVEEAAKKGYLPDYQYITKKILK